MAFPPINFGVLARARAGAIRGKLQGQEVVRRRQADEAKAQRQAELDKLALEMFMMEKEDRAAQKAQQRATAERQARMDAQAQAQRDQVAAGRTALAQSRGGTPEQRAAIENGVDPGDVYLPEPTPRAPVLGSPEYLKAQEELARMRNQNRPPPAPSLSASYDDEARKYVASRVIELTKGTRGDIDNDPVPGLSRDAALRQAQEEADAAYGTKLAPPKPPNAAISFGYGSMAPSAPKAASAPTGTVGELRGAPPPAGAAALPKRQPGISDADRWEELKAAGMSSAEATAQVQRERGGE